jgi:hypothetical protein
MTWVLGALVGINTCNVVDLDVVVNKISFLVETWCIGL